MNIASNPHPDKVSVSVVNNPFNPKDNLESSWHLPGLTVNAFVESRYPEIKNFPVPVVCVVNGVPTKREFWGQELAAGDFVVFIPALGDPVTIIIWLIVLIVALVVALVLSPAQSPTADTTIGTTPEASPVYDLRGQKNQNKLGNPIERLYGRCRHWPSFAAAPYTRFIGNDQWLYQLFCLGHGKFEIDTIFIEDTPITSFQYVEYEVIEPGGVVNLFPNNIYTSTEVGGIELFGPNETAYTDWTPGFVACPPFTRTKQIELDIILPKGMYFQSAGKLTNRTTVVQFQARLIDDAGTPDVTGWQDVLTFTKTLKTTTPQRYTESITVLEGRYEVRARRTNNAETDYAGADQTIWRALRAFLPSVLTYPGLTMLAVKAKASNNLNDNASTRVNFIGTPKLRVYDSLSGVWVQDQVTRSPIWAFCDIFTAAYGGGLPDEFLDLDALAALAFDLEVEGIFFDWVFDQRATTWEAAKVVCGVMRSVPVLNGSKIGIARELPQVVPTAFFNMQNIIRDSFNYELKLREVESNDGIEIEYQNPDTWSTETVLCLSPGDAGNKPKTLKIPGITDRTRAYRAGMYKRQCDVLLREQCNFRTGMEGLIPSYGSLISVCHDLPRWGTGGYVRDIDGVDVQLSRPVTFGVGTHYLLLRKKNGSVFGPVIVVPKYTPAPAVLVEDVVTIQDSINPADFYFSANADPAIFLFGTAGTWGKLMTVSKIVPSGDEEVEITALVYNPNVFAFDEAIPPALNAGFFLDVDAPTPEIKSLRVEAHPTSTQLVILRWQAINGIGTYVVETSLDGLTYNTEATTVAPYYVMDVGTTDHMLYVKVSATNVGVGIPALWQGQVGGVALARPNDVTGLVLSWLGLTLGCSWVGVVAGAHIDGYIVRVFTRLPGGSFKLARTAFVLTNAYDYTYTMAVNDSAVGRECRVLVTAVNITAESLNPLAVDGVNPSPDAPTVLKSVSQGIRRPAGGGAFRDYLLSWVGSGSEDFRLYKVWASSTANFTSSDTNLVYEGANPFYTLPIPATNTGGSYYTSPARHWRVAEYDVWGNDSGDTASASIAAVQDANYSRG